MCDIKSECSFFASPCDVCKQVTVEQALDKLLDAFAYVREIGRGGDNHIGIELTVSVGDTEIKEGWDHRKDVKQFLLDTYNHHISTGQEVNNA